MSLDLKQKSGTGRLISLCVYGSQCKRNAWWTDVFILRSLKLLLDIMFVYRAWYDAISLKVEKK